MLANPLEQIMFSQGVIKVIFYMRNRLKVCTVAKNFLESICIQFIRNLLKVVVKSQLEIIHGASMTTSYAHVLIMSIIISTLATAKDLSLYYERYMTETCVTKQMAYFLLICDGHSKSKSAYLFPRNLQLIQGTR